MEAARLPFDERRWWGVYFYDRFWYRCYSCSFLRCCFFLRLDDFGVPIRLYLFLGFFSVHGPLNGLLGVLLYNIGLLLAHVFRLFDSLKEFLPAPGLLEA